MDKTNLINKDDINQISNTPTDKKATYEAEKEQERKRRFNILSGHLKPIHTSLNLKEGEHAYYQTEVERKVDREHIETHTTGDARSPFVKGGILRGNIKINTTTTQSHSTSHETIDSGTLLFTNLRILFIGKQVVSIPYKEMLTIEFVNEFRGISVIIRYPEMLKNESYSIEQDKDAKFYYQGLMRTLEKDKSEAIEAEVDMNDYPRFVSDNEKKAKTRKSWTIKICVWVALIFIIPNIFWNHWDNLLNFAIIDMFIAACCAISYSILKLSNRNGNYDMGVAFTKWLFLWSLGIFFLCLFEYAVFNTTPSSVKTVQKPKTVPTKQIQKPTIGSTMTARQQEDAQAKKDTNDVLTTYITQESKVLTDFQAEDKILDEHPPKSIYYNYANDPIYTKMSNKYYDLANQAIAPTYPVGGTGEYEEIIMDATGLMLDSINDLIYPNKVGQKYPHVAEVQIAIARVERDIAIAKEKINTDALNNDTSAVENDFDSDHFDGYTSETDVLTKLDTDVTAPDSN